MGKQTGAHRIRRGRVVVAGSVALAAVGAPLLASQLTASAATTDITAAIRAGQDVTLTGDAVVNLPTGTTTYNGVISGTGTLTVNAPGGSGTLVLTKDSDFTLPASRRHQTVTTTRSAHPVTTVTDPDQPAVIVSRGATLQYSSGGSTGIIGHYPYGTPGYALNEDNIRVDGTLVLQTVNRNYNLGTISGSGLVIQPRFTWGTLDLAGTHPFSGVIYNGTGMALAKPWYPLALPNAKAIVNEGSAIVGTPYDYTLRLRQDFYEDHYGNDINFHTARGGLVVVSGVYSYADQGVPNNPSLSNPSLNLSTSVGNANTRGVNIEGAHVQWGDGTTSRFFLPATPANSYINIHNNGTLAFDYDGPVTLDTPISGGVYHNSLSTPAYSDISLIAHPGNAVTFATPMNYHGTTTIGAGATLTLGTGAAGGDSSLLTGTAADSIDDRGTLVVRNTAKAVSLSRISGSGSLLQAGSGTTTLTGATSYTGSTTVSAGTLAVTGGSLATGSGVALTRPGAVLDLRKAGDQTVHSLSGVQGSTILLGDNTLTVDTSASTVFSGRIVGGTLNKTGSGSLTLTDKAVPAGHGWTTGTAEQATADAHPSASTGATAAATGATSTGSTAAAAAASASPAQVAGASGDLAQTGSSVPTLGLAGATAALLATGATLLLRNRRRSAAGAGGGHRRRTGRRR
ncbi:MULTISPECIES: autotransporter-associated beta strand repeat-containing protein [Streptacidiphilus]|uniref:Autotransporter-associated beta strand repeat-containing protein n=1 Tax=Streptacidiphilus cavernicola TaxID=3342716 RepID=A0ABV6UIV1_9ACTN|nr:autotransporter-associated beta strand repeat-containing protein [Streptacidiphilus jeojiense]